MLAALRCATEATRLRGFFPGVDGPRPPPRGPPHPAADHTDKQFDL